MSSKASNVIPAQLPSDMLAAAQFYRDEFHWAVHPLRAPDDQNVSEKARGKAPILPGWRRWRVDNVTDKILDQYFSNGRRLNLGVVVRQPWVIVDLDSHQDGGQSAAAFVSSRPELAKVPRERSASGCHLHFRCLDLPLFAKKNAPNAKATANVSAELYHDGQNIVVAPSVHASGHVYRWEVAGEIPEIGWADLKRIFGFADPVDEPAVRGRKPKAKAWWTKFKGQLNTLNIVSLAKALGIYGEPIDVDENKHSVRCPWHDEHSEKAKAWKPSDSSACIWEAKGDQLPSFKCLHSGVSNHAETKHIEHLLEWAEGRKPGIVDEFCAEKRVYIEGATTRDGRPQVVQFGLGKELSAFATEIGGIVAPKHEFFVRGNAVVVVRRQRLSETVEFLAFHEVTAVELCSEIEKYIEVGRLFKDESGAMVFMPCSLNREQAATLLAASQFRDQLPLITRILDVPTPLLDANNLLVWPKRGFDQRFGTYTDPSAPRIREVTLNEAKDWLGKALSGFCIVDAQSRVHALSRMITAFCRGITGWSARVPLFVFRANQPRVGKDYCASCTTVLFEGHPYEDAPLESRNEAENKKRITSALTAGRRFMHFANCVGLIGSENLMHAVTDKVWGDRRLGSNNADADLKLPNEIIFSLSGNVGISFKEDFIGRCRFIELAYGEEPNNRRFDIPDLHGWILTNRGELLSALAALVRHWNAAGRPSGRTPFASFPEWARVVGGIMTAAGLGDPCLPHLEAAQVGGDKLVDGMRTLFGLCYKEFPEQWVKKPQIYGLLEKDPDAGLFDWWGEPVERSFQIKLGNELRKYAAYGGRSLDGIWLVMDEADKSRPRFKFTRQPGGSTPAKNEAPGPIESVACASPGRPSDANGANDANVSEPEAAQEPKLVGERITELSLPHLGGSENIPTISTICKAAACVTDPSALGNIARAITASPSAVALDVETYGEALNPFKGGVRLLSLGVPGQAPWLLDLRALGYDVGPLARVLAQKEVIAHNLKFDALWLRVKCGLRLSRVFCTLTASRLLTAGTDTPNDLGACLERHLSVRLPKDQGGSNWASTVLTAEQLAYAAHDVLHLHALRDALQGELKAANLQRVAEVEMALLPAVVDMEFEGVPFDRHQAEQLLQECQARQTELAEELRDSVGHDVNPNSTPQIRAALQAAGVEVRDTAEQTLAACAHPLAKKILLHRAASSPVKQINTLLKAISADGRIHGSFNPTGTDTGRFSSQKPNLQNIGRGKLRGCIAASSGEALVVGDYSQVELRIAADQAGEEEMLDAFHRGEDLHVKTASAVLSKPAGEMTKEDRQLAKAVNFGLLYGQYPKGLVAYARTSYGVSLTLDEAERIRSKFFDAYPRLKKWHERAWHQAKGGASEVRTALGRRRLLPPSSDWERFTALVNTPVQGGAADGLKLAMIELAHRLPALARMIITAHDEIVVRCPMELANQVQEMMRLVMTEAMASLFSRTQIEVEVKVCSNWGEK